MTVRDILTLRRGECKFCITDDTPFIFCGEPATDDNPYCQPHRDICCGGFGKDVAAIETMIYAMEGNVTRSATAKSVITPVDVQIRGGG